MTGYTRQEVFNDGDIILAEHGNNELNQVEASFSQATGHTHSGVAAEGGYVPLISDAENIDKVEIVVGGAKTTGTHQVTGAVQLDDSLNVDGTTTLDGLTVATGDVDVSAGSITVSGTVDGRDLTADGSKLDGIDPGATADQIASEVPFTPVGRITSTDTQSAIAEVSSDIATQIAAKVHHNAVVDVNFAASPYSVTSSNDGNMLQVDTSGGDVVFTLPDSTGLSEDIRISIVKYTADANQVTVNASGTDTINGGASLGFGIQYEHVHFVLDQSGGEWIAAGGVLGGVSANQVTYNNGTSGLSATNAQDALDELYTSTQTSLGELDTNKLNLAQTQATVLSF